MLNVRVSLWHYACHSMINAPIDCRASDYHARSEARDRERRRERESDRQQSERKPAAPAQVHNQILQCLLWHVHGFLRVLNWCMH